MVFVKAAGVEGLTFMAHSGACLGAGFRDVADGNGLLLINDFARRLASEAICRNKLVLNGQIGNCFTIRTMPVMYGTHEH